MTDSPEDATLTESFADVLAGFTPNATLSSAKVERRFAGEARYSHPSGRRVRKVDPQTNHFVFQVTDFDHGVLDASGRYGVHLFGVTKDGCPVLFNVEGFCHHIDIPHPENFGEDDIGPLTAYLEGLLGVGSIVRILRLRHIRNQVVVNRFVRIETNHPSVVPKLRAVFQAGRCLYRDGLFTALDSGSIPSHDSYIMQFIQNTNIRPLTWVRVHPGKYGLAEGPKKISTCSVEASVHYTDLKLLNEENSGLPSVAPLRILSFDIETMVPLWRDAFCHPNSDKVLQIGCVVTCSNATDPFYRCIFTLDTCAEVKGCDVFSFKNEGDLLEEWRNFVIGIDPDVVVGYNSLSFDLPYLLVRARAVGITDFGKLGRLKDRYSEYDIRGYRHESREEKFKFSPSMSGRLHIDVYHWVYKNVPSTGPGTGAHKLNTLALQHLGEHKEDVNYKDIPKLQEGPEASRDTRRTLAVYCMKDSYLALRLYKKLDCLRYYSDIARDYGVPINWLLSGSKLVQVV